jgi:hypothetical protein
MSLRFGLCTCARNPQRLITDKNYDHSQKSLAQANANGLRQYAKAAVTGCIAYSYYCRSYYYLGKHRLHIVLVVAVLVNKQENTIYLSQRQPRVGKMAILGKFPKVHHGHGERIVSRRFLLPGQELD